MDLLAVAGRLAVEVVIPVGEYGMSWLEKIKQ